MDKITVLIVDDEKEIRDLLTIYLKNEGYEVLKASNGKEGLELIKKHQVHLLILDIMMPEIDGIDMCMKVRAESDIPIIMLSAKTQDMDKILGLTTGADDYITKPFNPLGLIARVKSQLRRYIKMSTGTTNQAENKIKIGEIQINISTHEVIVGKQRVRLTPREFAILELLARNPNVVFSTEKIYETIWEKEAFDSDNTIMVHIRKIREKIEKNPRKPQYIKTVWGVGYKIENNN